MMAAFWDTPPCSLVEADRRFRGAYYPHHRPDVGGAIFQKAVIFILATVKTLNLTV
jgi:hypothetical protein